ncbi:acyl-CoA dehydrogenase [Mycolicibacterium mageritense DSM 44476 = CIP 104973]|uniref:Acyl-CoA dehydrogenase FadE n=1 Tax=Mycolicibacterium mageritense TaxID=53462 RepID=A0ABM7I027_MYCME|nr:acyl-CoA dehydrogenase [Mycolicibacterium mageritense]MCC9186572.1 acyl-CoA dehydrogenase [Mycolicibacterium mageritense]BBX36220.1 putative acyl-CoA dehydrogenase FadE [Mycolicibacterium mageritense]CDO24332.1 acyl-CoA dehydrogenase [Mycolicibacterium mageritense DSM 44476 = CIP 104973]
MTARSDVLFDPNRTEFDQFDPRTREIFRATIDFFESHGKRWLKQQDRDRVWYSDFLDLVKREGIFATFLTPASEAGGDPDKRWDTARNAMYSQILGFYGMQYWYVWQVTILGLGPIWQSANEAARKKAAALLDSGEIFAFGLSEQAHGADVYSTDMVLEPGPDGSYTATGGKYYIGNGNLAGMVSVFGRRSDKPIIDSSDLDRRRPEQDFEGYLFFAADSRHPNYHLRRNVVDGQMYVAAFDLESYPVSADDILHEGKAAFNAAINTVNIGKFNLGFGAIGACEHAMYEAVTHAENRVLFGQRVTEFPQIRRMLADGYARLVGMKLYSERAVDYMRSASPNDRRYLLFNAIEKMNVTREGEKIVTLLADTIAARAFESDMYFTMALLGVTGLPRLEGTVHVNMALSLKFMQNYMFGASDAALAALAQLPVGRAPGPVLSALAGGLRAAGGVLADSPLAQRIPPLKPLLAEVPEIPTRRDARNDDFLFHQGPSSGLAKIRFGDWQSVLRRSASTPNVAIFLAQAQALQTLLAVATPTAEQQRNVDFLFAIGEMFTLVPYAQLILEQAGIEDADTDILDQLFEVLVTDMSTHATELHCHPDATAAQKQRALDIIRQPVADAGRRDRVVGKVRDLAGRYEMKP